MSDTLNLKDIERRAWLSFFEDGYWEIYFGFLLMAFALAQWLFQGIELKMARYGATGGLILVIALGLMALRQVITIPRMGRVRHGPRGRARKLRTFFAGLGFLIVNTVLWLLVSRGVFGLSDLGDVGGALLLGGLMFAAFSVFALLMDFARGFILAALIAATFIAAMLLNTEWTFVAGGGLIMLIGLVIFARFMASHPLPAFDAEETGS